VAAGYAGSKYPLWNGAASWCCSIEIVTATFAGLHHCGASALDRRFTFAIFPGAQSVICPTWQETYFALAQNFSLNASSKSNLQLPLSCPTERGVGHRHERWDGLRWTRQRRARAWSQGGYPVSDRTARRRTALKRLGRNFFRQHAGRSRRMARGSCGRQNRVVLAPVAGVKLMEIVQPNRAFDNRSSVSDGGKRNSSPGRARHKPLKPSRRESRVIRRTCGLPCAFLRTTAGVMGTRLSLRPRFEEGNVDAQLRARRAARSQCRIQPPAAPIENDYAQGVPTSL
jgi:hypothetical protein